MTEAGAGVAGTQIGTKSYEAGVYCPNVRLLLMGVESSAW